MSELPDEVWWYQGSNNNAESVGMEPEGQQSARPDAILAVHEARAAPAGAGSRDWVSLRKH